MLVWLRNIVAPLAALAALGLASPAIAQVSCPLSSQALLVFLKGGGALIVVVDTEVLATAGAPVSLGVYCGTSGQFPPPLLAGASYSWSTGQRTQRIDVSGPAPGAVVRYSVTVTSPVGTATFTMTLRGAPSDAPNCTVRSAAPQPIAPGATFDLTAACSPDATSLQWDAREFLGYMSIVGPHDQHSVTLRFNAAQPAQVMPIYLTASNAAGPGPYASFLATAGNPNAVLPLNAPRVSAGERHTCALTTAGGVKCWGDDTGGQLGDYRGADFYSTTPVNVLGSASQVASITAGAAHACSLGSNGGVRCWGDNSFGQIGDDSPAALSSFQVDVSGLTSGVASVATGSAANHTCAITTDGALRCWGRNDFGQLGTGLRFNAFAPLDVLGLSGGVAGVALGRAHTCAVSTNGAVKCWGANAQGELGDGSTLDHLTPTDVPMLSSAVAALAAGDGYSCALMVDRTVKCWGANLDGETGTASPLPIVPVPTSIAGLSNVISLSAGAHHACALVSGGALKCWGRNTEGQLGNGTTITQREPVSVAGMASGVISASAGGFHTCALIAGGGTACWGLNGSGRIGDGTVASRTTAQLVLGTLGQGFLDVTLEDGFTPPADRVPIFPLVATGTLTDLTANIQFRPQDVGSTGSIYVFALAPADRVKGAVRAKESSIVISASGAKDAPVACVLAQLNALGQLQAVSASELQAYARGVFTSAGQAVTILNGLPIAQLGASFFVGYGQDPGSMLSNGTNRSVAGPADAGAVSCQPQAPQTGWWWNPLEGGRGFSIEVQGNRLFFAIFHYDASGRATWNVSPGTTSLDGAYFASDLFAVTGGQTLGGAYRTPTSAKAGPITLAFNDPSHGTMIWPGGVVPIERMNLVNGGLAAAPQPNVPESGWWWNPQESGRGFFIEWQDGYADLAGYMYDDAGNPVWYISVYQTPDARTFTGAWWQYANGQSQGAPYRPATQVNNNVAPVTVQFQSATTATMTLPNGRTTSLVRQQF